MSLPSVRTLAVVAVVMWALAGALWWRSNQSTDPTSAANAAGSTSAAVGSASGTSASTASSAAASGSAPAPPPVTDVSACVQEQFAPGTFEKKPDFGFVCEETSAIKGGTRVKIQIVVGKGRGTPEGMREWAGLGWYEMAGFSVLRARCCNAPLPKRKWSFAVVPNCPIDKALDQLETVVRQRDASGTQAAAEEYSKTVRCLSQFGQGANFKRSGPPGAGESMLSKFLERAVAR